MYQKGVVLYLSKVEEISIENPGSIIDLFSKFQVIYNYSEGLVSSFINCCFIILHLLQCKHAHSKINHIFNGSAGPTDQSIKTWQHTCKLTAQRV